MRHKQQLLKKPMTTTLIDLSDDRIYELNKSFDKINKFPVSQFPITQMDLTIEKEKQQDKEFQTSKTKIRKIAKKLNELESKEDIIEYQQEVPIKDIFYEEGKRLAQLKKDNDKRLVQISEQVNLLNETALTEKQSKDMVKKIMKHIKKSKKDINSSYNILASMDIVIDKIVPVFKSKREAREKDLRYTKYDISNQDKNVMRNYFWKKFGDNDGETGYIDINLFNEILKKTIKTFEKESENSEYLDDAVKILRSKQEDMKLITPWFDERKEKRRKRIRGMKRRTYRKR